MKTILGHDFPQRNKVYMSTGVILRFMLMKINILFSDIKCLGAFKKDHKPKSNKWENYRYLDTIFFQEISNPI